MISILNFATRKFIRVHAFTSRLYFNKMSSTSSDLVKNGFVDLLQSNPKVTWDRNVTGTQLDKFKKVVQYKYNLQFDSYWDFHKWSVENYASFWEEIWHYFRVIASKSYDQVFIKTGSGFLDNEWFPGARMNFAENILRIRDNRVALLCADEFGNEDSVTFTEMFEVVKQYAAGFRKHGLKVGDRVACIMTNRKEAIFAMLATTSIGAIWTGPLPDLGPRAVSDLLKYVDPAMIIALDFFQDEGEQFYQFDKIVVASQSVPNVKKVIVLATKPQTVMRLSEIRKSILLEDFLLSGRTSEGKVPDIEFEQLPFNHPIAINFTSGTTGLPKGIVHSAGTFICLLRDYALHLNLKNGDIVYTYCAVGWTVWDNPIPSLALGVKLFLFNGSPAYDKKGLTLWDFFSKYKIKCACLAPLYIDILEKLNIVPEPDMNFSNLAIVTLGGTPAKIQNYEFLKKAKKNLFVCSYYGATEVFGAFSGFDLNLPSFSCECQVPALGVDLHVFDTGGRSVVGKRGEIVIKTPTPSFPIYLWNDENNKKIQETYLSKYPGVWTQNDEGWINPKTNGIVIIGRSDNTLKQEGLRFCSEDVYFGISHMKELEDFVCVGQDRWNKDSRAVLFVKLKKGYTFTDELKTKIIDAITKDMTIDYVPKLILEIQDIPYNLNNKKLEIVVKKILATNTIPEVSNIKNPDCLQYFLNIPEVLSYNKE